MGTVGKETLNQNKGMHEWEAISLSEINTIKGLIKNRFYFDESFVAKLYESNNPIEFSGVPTFREIIICVYLDLERLMDNANLTEKQEHVIYRLMCGETEFDIADSLGDDIGNVRGVFNTACQKIKEQNDLEWREWLETSGYIKIPSDVTYKQCSKCQKWLRADGENFRPRQDSADGFRLECRKCESSAKKTP